MQSSTVTPKGIDARGRPAPAVGRPSWLIEAGPLLVTALAGILCYGLFYNRGIWLSVVGYSVSPAERVLQGEIPYRDFLYNYTPGSLWVNALLMRYFGPTLLTINMGLLAFKVITLVALYFAARRLAGSLAALTPVFLTLGWLGHKYIFGVVPTQYSLLFVLLGLLCMLNYDRTNRLIWLLVSGLAVGMVFVFKYNVGVVLIACATLAVAIREYAVRRPDIGLAGLALCAAKRSVILWTGFAIVVLSLFAYLAYHDALGAMVSHFLHHASSYSEERAVPLPSFKLASPTAAGILLAVACGAVVASKAPRLFEPYLLFVTALGSIVLLVPGRFFSVKASASASVAYMPILLFLVAGLILFWGLRRASDSGEDKAAWPSRNGPLAIVTLFALGAFMEMFPRADYYHLVRVLPPVFLLLLILLARALPHVSAFLTARIANPRRGVALSVSAPLLLLLFAGVDHTWRPHFNSRLGFVDRQPVAAERARGMLVTRRQAAFVEKLDSLIRENSSPEDYIFSFAQRGSGFYFLADRNNPTRFVWWRSVGINARAREGVLAMIAERKPRLILLQNSLSNKTVREVVAQNYRPIGSADNIVVYDRNE